MVSGRSILGGIHLVKPGERKTAGKEKDEERQIESQPKGKGARSERRESRALSAHTNKRYPFRRISLSSCRPAPLFGSTTLAPHNLLLSYSSSNLALYKSSSLPSSPGPGRRPPLVIIPSNPVQPRVLGPTCRG